MVEIPSRSPLDPLDAVCGDGDRNSIFEASSAAINVGKMALFSCFILYFTVISASITYLLKSLRSDRHETILNTIICLEGRDYLRVPKQGVIAMFRSIQSLLCQGMGYLHPRLP